MHIRRKPYEFWNYRDTRKESFPALQQPSLPKVETDQPRSVTAVLSHHVLLPLAELPSELIRRLKADLTFRNPEFEKAREYGKGFVSYAIPEFVRFYSSDSTWLGLPRSVKMTYLHNRFHDCGLVLNIRDSRPAFPDMGFQQREGIRPYFYQNDAIERILQGNVIIKLKCGRGKTMLALMAVARLRLRTLIIVRTKILLKQWIESINRVMDIRPEDIGVIQGKTRRHGSITVAMEETLVNLSRQEKRDLGDLYGHVIIDECLVHNTKVLTDFGYKTIGQIVDKVRKRKKVLVLSYNEQTQRKEFKRVLAGKSKGFRAVLKIHFENGKTIRCTPEHPFYVKGKGWVCASDLKPEDDLLD